jgi:exodeoxyribonuclease VII large subunit
MEPAPTRTVYQVSELADILRLMLEDSLPSVWVQGELSNFRNPSGHWYFTLKDSGAQLRCAMFKNKNYYVKPLPKDGDAVLVRGQVSFYTARGDLQLIIEHMEPAGAGALLRAFEQLKAKLSAEGLFDAALKRSIPAAPHAIGVITSPTGAALQDVLTALRRRFPLTSVFLYPVPVQGDAAAPAIAKALAELPKLADVEVVLLVRGGGSLEDLWCFNDERVARAIRACAVPVVSGVGHEIDFTIADFAADLRAPTPTAAAELVSPDQAEWRAQIRQQEAQMAQHLGRGLRQRAESLQRLQARLQLTHPGRRMQQATQRLDELLERLQRAHASASGQRAQGLHHLQQRLLAANPLARITQAQQGLKVSTELLRMHLQRRLQENQDRLHRNLALLDSFNPRAILERGYSIARGADGRVLRDVSGINPGDGLEVLLASGVINAKVTSTATSS